MDDLGGVTYLVGLSGPPRSGKDTIGNLLAGLLRDQGVPVEVHALSLPMRMSIYGMLGKPYTLEHYEANKDVLLPTENGRHTTIRQEMIALSDHHVKPRLGNGWWGRAMLNQVGLPLGGVVIVTDMGFAPEHDLFSAVFGGDRCAWVHLTRPGTDFSQDSRGYVGEGTVIHNAGDPETEARRLYGRLANQYRWRFLT